MSKIYEKEYILENLDCSHCAADIERKTKEIDGVLETNVDFISKYFYIKSSKEISGDHYEEVADIVELVDADIVLKDMNPPAKSDSEFSLENLSCAHCSAEIEEEINKRYKGANANIDFVSKTLYLEGDKELSVDQLNDIIRDVDQDVYIDKQIDKKKKRREAIEDEESFRKTNYPLIIALALYALSYLNFSNNVKDIMLLTSYFLVGHKIILRSINNIKKGNFLDENFLMTIATLGAMIIGSYEEAASVMLFYTVGEYFQDRAVDNSKKSILELMDIRPDYVNLVIGEDVSVVDPEDVSIGSTILVRPGEKIPLDGQVIRGESYIDSSKLTGESLPVLVKEGDQVLSGSINENGLIYIKTSKAYEESTAYKIVELMEKSNRHKSNTENMITKFSRYYTPIVVGLALIIGLLVPVVIQEPFKKWIYRSLVFLVASCPCAILLSIPLSYFAGIGRGSKEGVLIKGSNHLETLSHINQMVFDKTGTLTNGVFAVSQVEAYAGYSREDVIKYAAIGEAHSNHPIGKAIIKAYGGELEENKISDYQEVPGKGLIVNWDGQEIMVGNDGLFTDRNIEVKTIDDMGTKVYIGLNGEFIGSILLADQIKDESAQLMEDLKKLGIENLVILTGDKKAIADHVGKKIGVDQVYSQLLPEDKVNQLEILSRKENSVTGFVGDGINDAPVLAMADLGISMGNIGSDAAIEASDIVIMKDDISKITTSIKLAKFTRKIVIQNVILTLGVKVIVLGLGAAGIANMWMAVFADVGVALLAVLNSLRLLWGRIE